MTNEIVSVIWRTLATVIVTSTLTYVVTLYKQEKTRNTALQEGLQALLRAKIVEVYRRHVEQDGWIPLYTRESIFACYEAYEKLGKNGVINDYMKQILDLPTVPPAE